VVREKGNPLAQAAGRTNLRSGSWVRPHQFQRQETGILPADLHRLKELGQAVNRLAKLMKMLPQSQTLLTFGT
jgi:hypothetical protein